MNELRGEDIFSVYTNRYGEMVALTKDGGLYYMTLETVCKIMKNSDYVIKKKVKRTHIIDVIR
jgi:hypothetical protein